MTWSTNQFAFFVTDEEWMAMMNNWVPAAMLIGTMVITIMYGVVHSVLTSHSILYRDKLSYDQQSAVLTHVIEAVILLALFFPWTYLMLSAYFEEQTMEEFKGKGRLVGIFMNIGIIMYLVELTARCRNLRPFLLIHHVGASGTALFATVFMTSATLRAASLLMYFITYEGLLFVGLVMYRLCPNHKATKTTILAGMAFFGLSRPLQVVWILSSLYSVRDKIDKSEGILFSFLTLGFTLMQFYSLNIHYAMYKRCGKAAKPQHEKSLMEDMDGVPSLKPVPSPEPALKRT